MTHFLKTRGRTGSEGYAGAAPGCRPTSPLGDAGGRVVLGGRAAGGGGRRRCRRISEIRWMGYGRVTAWLGFIAGLQVSPAYLFVPMRRERHLRFGSVRSGSPARLCSSAFFPFSCFILSFPTSRRLVHSTSSTLLSLLDLPSPLTPSAPPPSPHFHPTPTPTPLHPTSPPTPRPPSSPHAPYPPPRLSTRLPPPLRTLCTGMSRDHRPAAVNEPDLATMLPALRRRRGWGGGRAGQP